MASNSTGHGYLGSELPLASADSQPRAASQLKDRDDLSSETVFRLHILGKRNWDKSQIDETKVEQLVRNAFDVTPDAKIIVKSLADHPVRQALVATLNFSQIPKKISQTRSSLQEFDGTAEELSLDLDTHFHGFTPLHSGTSSEYTCDFIALSGLGGHAFGSFKRRGGDFMWLRDDLPISIPDSRVFIYGYDTGLQSSTSFQSLEDLGLAFKGALKSLLRTNLKSDLMKPLVLLGHSLGGLIVKEALCQMSANPKEANKDLLKSIRAILFFGTPNHGMDITSLIPMVEGQANESFLRSLGTDSADLRRQAQQWSKAFDDPQSGLIFSNVEITSYYETSTSQTAVKVDGTWKMSGPPARLVDRSSATHGRPWETSERLVQPIDRDHSGLVKFRSRTDPVYVNHVLPRLESYKQPDPQPLDEKGGKIVLDTPSILLVIHAFANSFLVDLSLDYPDRVSRKDQIMTARDNTCKWLVQHPTYRSWLKGSDRLLWLEGHPGTGKSTLTKYAVEATSNSTSPGTVVLTHFFHGRGSEMQKSALGLFRSLAYQLFRNFSTCWTELKSKHDEIGRQPTWQLEWLASFLERQLRHASTVRPIIIFVDALDECEVESRDSLGDFLTEVVQGPAGAGLKIFVSCRHYPNLFSEGSRIQTEFNNMDDIAIFVISKLQVIQERKRRLLAREIIDNARGNFQWAQIVTKQSISLHRKGRTAADIQQKIRQLPKDLHELYDSLFKDADPQDLQLAYRLFHWICFAARPLCLYELQYVIMLSPDTKERSFEEIFQRSDFREEVNDLINTIIDVSRGLVEILFRDNYLIERHQLPPEEMKWCSEVQLIHQTVKEYLMDIGLPTLEGRRHNFFGVQSNCFIIRTCLRYVMMDDFAISPIRGGLNTYIFRFLGKHLLQVDIGDVDRSDFVVGLGWPYNRSSLINLSIALHKRQDPVCSILLHWAAEVGLTSIAKSIVQRDFSQSEGAGKLPVSFVLRKCNKLFKNGHYNVNYRNRSGLTALECAVIEGHASVVQVLLQSPVMDPNVRNMDGRTPLHLANARGLLFLRHQWWMEGFHEQRDKTHQVVKTLLEHPGINSRIQDNRGRIALLDAIKEDDPELVKTNVDAAEACGNMSGFGAVPLIEAVTLGYTDIVKLLINCRIFTKQNVRRAYEEAKFWVSSQSDERRRPVEESMQLLVQTGLVRTTNRIWESSV